jgi:outer membrane murein-binding lipoprotein Lpp
MAVWAKPFSLPLKKRRSKAMQTGKVPVLAMALVSAGLSLSGCATEDYVNQHIAVVSQRIDGLEARLNQVDGTANQANQTAQAAMGSAQQANQRLDQLTARVDGIEQRLAKKKPRG